MNYLQYVLDNLPIQTENYKTHLMFDYEEFDVYLK